MSIDEIIRKAFKSKELTEGLSEDPTVTKLKDALREIRSETNGCRPSHIGQDRAYSIARNTLRDLEEVLETSLHEEFHKELLKTDAFDPIQVN
jgi:hypothetical protein